MIKSYAAQVDWTPGTIGFSHLSPYNESAKKQTVWFIRLDSELKVLFTNPDEDGQ